MIGRKQEYHADALALQILHKFGEQLNALFLGLFIIFHPEEIACLPQRGGVNGLLRLRAERAAVHNAAVRAHHLGVLVHHVALYGLGLHHLAAGRQKIGEVALKIAGGVQCLPLHGGVFGFKICLNAKVAQKKLGIQGFVASRVHRVLAAKHPRVYPDDDVLRHGAALFKQIIGAHQVVHVCARDGTVVKAVCLQHLAGNHHHPAGAQGDGGGHVFHIVHKGFDDFALAVVQPLGAHHVMAVQHQLYHIAQLLVALEIALAVHLEVEQHHKQKNGHKSGRAKGKAPGPEQFFHRLGQRAALPLRFLPRPLFRSSGK